MAVTSTTNRKSYSGDAVTTSFATSPVVFFDSSDLAVSVISAAGVATALVENTDYTVSGGDGSTGTVNLAAGSAPYGAPASGTTLLILRVVPLTQPVDFVQNDGSDAEVQETALDRLTMMLQQQGEELGRALKVSESESAQDEIVVVGGGGYYLRRNAGNTAWELAVGDANDSTFTQSGTGAVERSVTSKLGETVSVTDFGATGDGVTDDYAAIAAAVATGAGTIFFPDGTYRTSDTIVLGTVGQRLVGQGRNTTIIAAAFQGGAVVEINQARCGVSDMAISSLAGSARRSASPLGVTPPSAAVDGLSMDRGIYLNEVGLLTYTNISRVDIQYQPGDGLNMAGAGSGTVIEQVGVSYVGGHGMYFDDGDRDGTAKTRNGIVDIRDCVIQQCWGHGVCLAADSAVTQTVFRYTLHNVDVFDVCLGDGGTDQPAFYTTVKAAVAIRAQNTVVEQCGLSAETGVVLSNAVDVRLESNRYVDCDDYGVIVNTGSSRVRILHPYFTASPGSAGIRVTTSCDNIVVDGMKSSEVTTPIDAESETRVFIDGKRCFTVAGSSSLWYDEQIKEATIASGVCNIQSAIVDMIGEGDVADSVNQFRFATSIEVPDGYRFTVLNTQGYDLTLQDRTVIGGSANIEMQGAHGVLETGESLSFIVKSGVYYAIGREVA